MQKNKKNDYISLTIFLKKWYNIVKYFIFLIILCLITLVCLCVFLFFMCFWNFLFEKTPFRGNFVGIFLGLLTYPLSYQNGLESRIPMITILMILAVALYLFLVMISENSLSFSSLSSVLSCFFASFFIPNDLQIEYASISRQTNSRVNCAR